MILESIKCYFTGAPIFFMLRYLLLLTHLAEWIILGCAIAFSLRKKKQWLYLSFTLIFAAVYWSAWGWWKVLVEAVAVLACAVVLYRRKRKGLLVSLMIGLLLVMSGWAYYFFMESEFDSLYGERNGVILLGHFAIFLGTSLLAFTASFIAKKGL